MKTIRILCYALLMCGVVACSSKTEQAPKADTKAAGAKKQYQIAVIPKGTANPFWKTVHAGAAKASKELGVKITWTGPENEDDRKQQMDVVQNFISTGVDAIVLAPLDDVALARSVETAVARKIPVVIIDSDLKSEAQSSFVATDNLEGGCLGARRLGEVMGGKGKAILLRYNPGSASTDNRERGFLEEMKAKFPNIELVSTNQYAGVTKESAIQASQNLLAKYGEDFQGIFCPNESSAFGMLRALEISGKAGRIKFVGFDASQGLVDGMKAGNIAGLVAQDPFDMGYRGVKTAVAVLNGETVQKRIPTRLAVITPQNLNTPEIQELIAPELGKWLD